MYDYIYFGLVLKKKNQCYKTNIYQNEMTIVRKKGYSNLKK